MPLKKRIAATQLETVKLEVGDAVLELSGEVRSAFYAAQGAAQTLAMRAMVDEAAATSAVLAERQREAGNMSDLAFSSERALASQAHLDFERSQGEAAVARERLIKLMGLWGKRTQWKLAPRLPELPAQELALEHLESLAIAKRLDIGAARREVQSLEYASSLAKTTRWTGIVNVSVEAGRLRSTHHLLVRPRGLARDSALRSTTGVDCAARRVQASGREQPASVRHRSALGRAFGSLARLQSARRWSKSTPTCWCPFAKTS